MHHMAGLLQQGINSLELKKLCDVAIGPSIAKWHRERCRQWAAYGSVWVSGPGCTQRQGKRYAHGAGQQQARLHSHPHAEHLMAQH
jgi:hypothetical protein